MSSPRGFRFAVNVAPKPGILDPQGRAVEASLGHLGIEGVTAVRVGRRVELTVTANDESAARDTVERLAGELLANPLIESHAIELLGSAPDALAPDTLAPDALSPQSPVGSTTR